jgi:hypothetical protein
MAGLFLEKKMGEREILFSQITDGMIRRMGASYVKCQGWLRRD